MTCAWRASTSWSIDDNPDNREAARADGVALIESEAADDEVLTQAGIDRARGVIACVDSDAENIFITLTARELRADILIIARASAEDSEKKLLRAGADRVISPYKTSGPRWRGSRCTRRSAARSRWPTTGWRRSRSRRNAPAAGKRIEEVRGRLDDRRAAARPDGRLEPQPAAETVIERRRQAGRARARPRRSSASRRCSSPRPPRRGRAVR